MSTGETTTEGEDMTNETEAFRARIIAARILVVVGIVLLVVSLLANFVKREALDEETFRQTLAGAHRPRRDPRPGGGHDGRAALHQRRRRGTPRSEVAREPPVARGADRGPRAKPSTGRPGSCSSAPGCRTLRRVRVVVAAAGGQRPRGRDEGLETEGGDVALDLRPLVVRLGDRFGFLGNVDETLPPDAGGSPSWSPTSSIRPRTSRKR